MGFLGKGFCRSDLGINTRGEKPGCCAAAVEHPQPTPWEALELGWPFRVSLIEGWELGLHSPTEDSIDEDAPMKGAEFGQDNPPHQKQNLRRTQV